MSQAVPDPLQQKITALLEESRAMQASIKQLTLQEENSAHTGFLFDHPVALGLEGLLLGATALFFGGVLGGGFAWHRLRARPVLHTADFRESVYNFRSTDEADPAEAELQQAVAQPEPPQPEPPQQAPPRAAPKAIAVEVPMAPIAEIAPAEPDSGFDFEAAASEVHRVRRSLAEKRAAREMWNASEPRSEGAPPDEENPPDLLPSHAIGDEVGAYPLDIDLDIDLGDDFAWTPPPQAHPETDAHADVIPITFEPETSAEATPLEDCDTSESADPGVKLELAQEFLALGLLDGARELAMEFMDSAQAPLHSQAHTLLVQIDARAQQEEKARRHAAEQAQREIDSALIPTLPQH